MTTPSLPRLFVDPTPNRTTVYPSPAWALDAVTLWARYPLQRCGSVYTFLSEDSRACREVAQYYRVDDRPSVAPEHEIRVIHIQVFPGQRLPLSAQIGALENGSYVVVMERIKRPHREEPGFTITSVETRVETGFVDTQKTLARLSSSLEGRPPSLGWLTSK